MSAAGGQEAEDLAAPFCLGPGPVSALLFIMETTSTAMGPEPASLLYPSIPASICMRRASGGFTRASRSSHLGLEPSPMPHPAQLRSCPLLTPCRRPAPGLDLVLPAPAPRWGSPPFPLLGITSPLPPGPLEVHDCVLTLNLSMALVVEGIWRGGHCPSLQP